MDVQWILFIVFVIHRVNSTLEDGCFPKYFYFGVATASYQIEGAWNVSGKGESIWDRYTHSHPESIFDHSTGDEAADSYHLFRQDAAIMADLGVKFYRFSISWPRILPDGMSHSINPDGIRYYKELLDELDRQGILYIVTMYHWDLPQPLQDLGGWTNPEIIDYYVDYARVLFDNFGDRVDSWLTFNEPKSFCGEGYGGSEAPGDRSSGFEDYMCAHHVLIAHAKVYRMYEQEYKKKQKGNVGITLNIDWMEPNSTSHEDKVAAEIAKQFLFGWFAHPIFSSSGDYPPIMRQRVDMISRQQGFSRSRLPSFSAEEVKLIQGSFDFMGVNHYTTHMVTADKRPPGQKPSFDEDMGVLLTQRDAWPKSNSTWLRIVPWGFRKALNWIRTSYHNPLMFVTENGISQQPGLHDVKRVQYMSTYLKALLGAMSDGCRVIGYTYWSLIDNFEWLRGYSERFGLYEVDYTSPNKTRTARLSAKFYSQIAKTYCIPDDYTDLLFSANQV